MWLEEPAAAPPPPPTAKPATTTAATNMVDDKGSNDGRMHLLLAATEMKTENSVAEPRKVGRDRSMSVPCRPTPTGMSSDVETMVTKAKRASSYLWMLLHSQVCTCLSDTLPALTSLLSLSTEDCHYSLCISLFIFSL